VQKQSAFYFTPQRVLIYSVVLEFLRFTGEFTFQGSQLTRNMRK